MQSITDRQANAMSSPQHVATQAGDTRVNPEQVMYIVPPRPGDAAAISRIMLSSSGGASSGLDTAIWSHTPLAELRERLGPLLDVQLCGLATGEPGPTWLLRVPSVESLRRGPGGRATVTMIDSRVLSLFDRTAVVAALAGRAASRGGRATETTDEPAPEVA